MPTALYIDADACPVKEEVYRVARRYGLKTYVVSNGWMQVPREALIEQVVVDAGPDVADDWIAERAGVGDVVITADIPLADRCLKAGAQALKSNGQAFTPDSIGSALAGRMVGEHLRSMGVATSGPPPFSAADRSRFLQALDQAVEELEFRFYRAGGPGGQNVNKVSTAVQMRFDVKNSSSLTEPVKARLMKLAGSRLTLDGVILINAVRFRTQERNRADAIQRLQALVDEASIKPVFRVPTRPTRASKERRLKAKTSRASIKSGRGRPSLD
ncbi:hypothetical protein LTR94_019084 [Friedmanniomyces endolithicus]|nr:hypothetical protein LTR94_019084 [Friedmanniomyces endolithicus]